MNVTAALHLPENSSALLPINGSRPTLFVKSTEHTLWMVTILTICAVGAFMNFCMLIITRPRARTASSFQLLVFHLILVDFLMCFINIPISSFIVQATRNGQINSSHICHYFGSINVLVLSLVNWADVGLSINRCIALYWPHSYRKLTTVGHSLAMIVLSWAICIALVTPVSFYIGGSFGLTQSGLCIVIPAGKLGQFFSFALGYVPYVINGVGACLIVWKTYQFSRNRVRNGQTGNDDNSRASVRRRFLMAKMSLLIFLWNCACGLPTFIGLTFFPKTYMTQPSIGLWLRIFLAVQYGCTPFILMLTNKEYRLRLSGMLMPKRDRSLVGPDRTNKIQQSFSDSVATAKTTNISSKIFATYSTRSHEDQSIVTTCTRSQRSREPESN